MNTMLGKVKDSKVETEIIEQINYLLHVRKVGKEFQLEQSTNTLDNNLRDLMSNFKSYTMNFKVLVVLIETGFCQK